MAKRGRPPKVDIKKLQDERNDYYESWQLNFEMLMKVRADFAEMIKGKDEIIGNLTDERDGYQKLAEDRFFSNQALSKQLVAAEDRIKELLAEIRIYEHEHSTLRHIIIDAIRGYDR